MGRRALSEGLAETLVNEIVNGTYPPDSMLPSTDELSELSGLSRLTVREAIKLLVAKHVLRAEQGRGTFVNPVNRWSPLDPVLLLARSSLENDELDLPRKFVEARRVIEVAAAEMAAARCEGEDLDELERTLAEMRAAASANDVGRFVTADIAFHQRILDVAGNPFIAAIFDPMAKILELTRYQTSAHAPVRSHAIDHHQRVYEAMAARSPRQASEAMLAHMEQTNADIETYVKSPWGSMLAASQGTTAARRLEQRSSVPKVGPTTRRQP
jgi:GntR family transcriptional regulator, transcriptional repressor for pyruvate dehydrogenase complex